MLAAHTCFSLQASAAMATQGSGGGGASSSSAKSGSAQSKVTMPLRRQAPPAGYGKGIDYQGAASASPDDVPHLSQLQNTSKAWLSNGEMVIVQWPPETSMAKAFPAPGATDCLVDLRDEVAVFGASFTMRAQRKRKTGDVSTYNMLRIVGPAGTVVPLYHRLRTVAGICMKSFKGLPPANRVRVFRVSEFGWDYDNKGFLHTKEEIQDVDGSGLPVDEIEVFSDDEYTEVVNQGEDYRQTMKLSLPVGELDVEHNELEESTGRKTHHQHGINIGAEVLLNARSTLLFYLLEHARKYIAAAPACCLNIPPKTWMTEQLDAAEARGPEFIELGVFANKFMVSISTNMGRNKQCIAAQFFNLVTSFVYFPYIRFVVTTFGNDEEDVNLLRTLFAPAIENGILIIASGGMAGAAMSSKAGRVDKPDWMPSLPDHTILPGQQMMPKCRYWHSSLCKNTSHMVADHKFQSQANLYINTDCDNFWPTAYLDNVLALWGSSQNEKGLCIIPIGLVDGGTTGRMCYRPDDFWAIGGYDENLTPAGGQDVQLRLRLGLYGEEKGNGQQLKKIKNYQLVGGCLPNDFECTTMKHDRGLAKTANIDPALLKTLPGPEDKKWHKMNAQNWQKNVTPGLTAKQWLCNEKMVDGKTKLGYWWNSLPKCSVVTPENIEGMADYDWPVTKIRSPQSMSADAVPSAALAVNSEAVPDVTASAGSASTGGGAMADLAVPIGKMKKLMVNIYVVGIARLIEFGRTEHTCSVIHGLVRHA